MSAGSSARADVRRVVEDHLAPYLRTGRLMLRDPGETDGAGGAALPGVEVLAHAVRVDLTLADGALDGVVHTLALPALPPVDLDEAVGVLGRRMPDRHDHAALLFGFLDCLERLEEAALTRESWLLLVERADELPRR